MKTKVMHSIVPKEVEHKKKGGIGFEISASEYNTIAKQEDYEYITLEMIFKSPIIISFPWIAFDGIISQMLLNLSLGKMFYNLNSDKPINSKVKHYMDSPILHDPVPSCSVIHWFNDKDEPIDPKYDVNQHIITKKWHDEHSHEIQTKTTYILKAGGDYLNFFLRYPALLAYKGVVHLYAKPLALELLMTFVKGIGKKINMGNGAISSFKIYKNEKKQSHYDYEKGISLRPIPIRFLEEYDKSQVGMVAWKPPYWSKLKLEKCVPPNTRCTLKEIETE